MFISTKYKDWNIYYSSEHYFWVWEDGTAHAFPSDTGGVGITKFEDGREELYFTTHNDQKGVTKKKLIEFAEEVGFEYNAKWSGIKLGQEFVKFLNANPALQKQDQAQSNIDAQRSASTSIKDVPDDAMSLLKFLAARIGFKVNPDWDKATLFDKIVDFIGSK